MMNFNIRGGNFAMPAAAIHQQIFGATFERDYGFAAQQLGQVFRDRPAQLGVADNDIPDGQASEMRGQAATCDLDFGEFGH